MAIPNPTAPTKLHSDYIFFFVGNEDVSPTYGSALAQVTDYESSNEANADEWRTYGSGRLLDTDDISYNFTLTILTDKTFFEYGRLHGVAVDGGETIVFDPTDELAVKLEYYSSDGTLRATRVLRTVQWRSITYSGSAGDYDKVVFTGIAASDTVTIPAWA